MRATAESARVVAFLDNAQGDDYIRHLCQSSVPAPA